MDLPLEPSDLVLSTGAEFSDPAFEPDEVRLWFFTGVTVLGYDDKSASALHESRGCFRRAESSST